jgi:hypothetical protein
MMTRSENYFWQDGLSGLTLGLPLRQRLQAMLFVSGLVVRLGPA